MEHWPRFLDQLRNRIRLKHNSIRAEQAYTDCVRRLTLYHDKRHLRHGCAGGGGVFDPRCRGRMM
ncbi:MAG: hypothetical protein L0H63_07120 [Nitrococcus sp.]|nr:hypothetical protein [Nitrococcus sp.]